MHRAALDNHITRVLQMSLRAVVEDEDDLASNYSPY
jgi:hypothetical protein